MKQFIVDFESSDKMWYFVSNKYFCPACSVLQNKKIFLSIPYNPTIARCLKCFECGLNLTIEEYIILTDDPTFPCKDILSCYKKLIDKSIEVEV